MNLILEILKDPSSIDVREAIAFDATGVDDLCVRFTPAAMDPWTGLFGPGSLAGARCNAAAAFNHGRLTFIIAGGQGYIVEPYERRLVHKTKWRELCEAHGVSNADLVIAADFFRIFAYSSAGLLFASEEVHMDGIAFKRVTTAESRGSFHDPDSADTWRPFRLDHATWTFERL